MATFLLFLFDRLFTIANESIQTITNKNSKNLKEEEL